MALRERLPKHQAFGIAGAAMAKARVQPIASVAELSVMGVSEVLAKIGQLRMLESRILACVDRMNPRFAVLIDNPGFNLRLAEQLTMRGIPVFQYVAPKLWAWGADRVEKIRRDVDTVLGILPFEEEFFRSRGVNYKYVGSPLKDRISKVVVRRESFGIGANKKIVACLPGSRNSEIALNLPTILRLHQALKAKLPDALFLVPVAPNIPMTIVADVVRSYLGQELSLEPVKSGSDIQLESWQLENIRFVRGMSLEVMAIADTAVVASGTATLECALLGTPMVVVYTMSSLSYEIARRVVHLPYVSLVNLLAGRRVVREYIQEFSIADVADEVASLLTNVERNQEMRFLFEDMRNKLQGMAAQNAADIIALRFPEASKAVVKPS
ncbi:MAG: hypothetical protein RL011_1672 [Pseudomonadota bacterium]